MLRAECVRAFRSRDPPARTNATRRAHNRHVDDGSSPAPGDTGRAGGGTALGAQLPRAEGSGTTNKTSRRSFLAVAAGALLLRGRTWDDSAAAAEQHRLGCADAAPASSPFDVRRYGPLEIAAPLRQMKDPCPVFDGRMWHLFGSAWAEGVDGCSILHAQAGSIEGPYARVEAATLVGVSGPQLSAPGVIHDGALFHMFIQTAFSSFGGTLEHLVSVDGARFDRVDTALTSDLDHDEPCIYDPQPAVIDGDLYLAFAAATTLGQPSCTRAARCRERGAGRGNGSVRSFARPTCRSTTWSDVEDTSGVSRAHSSSSCQRARCCCSACASSPVAVSEHDSGFSSPSRTRRAARTACSARCSIPHRIRGRAVRTATPAQCSRTGA